MESHYKLKKICTSSSRQDIVTGPRLVKAYKQPEYWLKCMKQKLFSDMEEEIAQDCWYLRKRKQNEPWNYQTFYQDTISITAQEERNKIEFKGLIDLMRQRVEYG